MAHIWGEDNRIQLWKDVELAVCDARAAAGDIPAEDAAAIRERARVDAASVRKREAVTHHDVAAFVDVLSESIGPASRHVHFGLTSSDVLDTALGLQLRDAGALLLQGVDDLRGVLLRRAREFKTTPMVGRTHGVHAEPITFGLKILHWWAEVSRAGVRLQRAVDGAARGKLSGAVGTFAHLPPEIEQDVCRRLGLQPEPIATQVVPRDRHAEFVLALAQLGAGLERLGTEIRHLQRTEVLEAQEGFRSGQKGSSSMPHKRNPVRCERLVGLARVLRSHAIPALENVSLWHERDISHSSAERVFLPDACLVADFMVAEARDIVDTLVVHPERMRRNLEATGGLAYSQTLLLELVRRGQLRDDAYRLVQAVSHQAWDSETPLVEVARRTPELVEQLGAKELQRIFDVEHHLRHVDAVFDRVEKEYA
jgi:adenylosuccinate lyase